MRRTYRLDEYLKFSIYMLIAALLLVPIVTFSNTYFPYIVPRNIVFRLLVEALVLVYIVLALRDRRYIPRLRKPLVVLLGTFMLALTVSSVFGNQALYSFWGNYERMEGLITLYHLAALFLVLIGTLRSYADFERVFQMSLFVAYVLSIIGVSQVVGVNLLQASSGGARTTATLGNATYLSAFLLIHIFFAAYFIVRRSSAELLKWFAWMSIGLDVLVLYFQVRYGFIGGEKGMLQQIFSHWLLLLTFIGVQAIPLAYFRFRHDRWYTQYADKALMLVLMVLFGFVLVNTQTRGALVGLAVSLVLGSVYIAVKPGTPSRLRIAGASVLLAIIVSVGSIIAFKDHPFVIGQPILARIASISVNDATTISRFATWQSAFEGFKERPILGWGVENFHQVFNKHFPVVIYTDEGTPLWFDRPHNLLIQYLVEGGIIALLVYLLLLGYSIVQLLKREYGLVGILLSGFIIAYVVQNLFVFDSINSYIPFYCALAFIYFIIYKQPTDEASQAVRRYSNATVSVAVMLAAIGIGYASYALNIKPYEANKEFVRYYFAQTGGSQAVYDPQVTEKVFTLFDTMPFLGKPELMGVYSEYAVDRIREGKASRSDLVALVDGLGSRFDRERAAGYAYDARFIMYQMNLYLNAGVLDDGYYEKILPLAEQALALSPDRPQLYYIRGRAYMNLGRAQEGLADFKKAVDLAPQIPDAHGNLFAAYATVGDAENAKRELAILSQLPGFDTTAIARFTSVYISVRMFDEAIELLTQAQEAIPQDWLQFQVGIAEVYGAAGKNAEARAAMQEAVKKDSSAATYAEDFYKRLDAGLIKR